MLKVFIRKEKKITYGLILLQLFLAIFFSTLSIAKTIENTGRINSVADAQSSMQNQENSRQGISLSAKQVTPLPVLSQQSNLKDYPLSLIKSPDKNLRHITHSLPDIGSQSTLAEEKYEEKLATTASQAGLILSSKNVKNTALSYTKHLGEHFVNQQINDWMNQYGKARISVSTEKTISGDFLLPIIASHNRFLFSQLGLRNTVNLGLGYRHHWGKWMYGVNTFYDYDHAGKNSRFGIGGEVWRDYLKVASNCYFGLTDWHQSKISKMDDYDERPVSGFDVRTEAYLPNYPQFGGGIKYEKYFGKKVHLSPGVDAKKLKDNPQSLILGLNYKPIPLLTLKGERATGDRNDTKISLDVNYRFGVPLSQQLNPDAVHMTHSLMGNKYDFVDRNYDIVMQYRKQELLTISLPRMIIAESKEVINLSATVNKAKYGLKKINWTVSSNFISKGGTYREISPTALEITLPAYTADNNNPSQEYLITAVAVDNKGNESNIATTIISVTPPKKIISDLTVTPPCADKSVLSASPTTIVADGQEKSELQFTLKDVNGNPLPRQKVAFKSSLLNSQISEVKDLGNGVYTASLTSMVVGRADINIMVNGKAFPLQSKSIMVNPQPVDLMVSVDSARKNIGETIILTVNAVSKDTRKAAQNVEVKLKAKSVVNRQGEEKNSGGLKLDGKDLSSYKGITDTNGNLVILVTDPKGIGVKTTLEIKSASGDTKSQDVIFNIKTSPDVISANMWGYMTDYLIVDGLKFHRPYLSTEKKGSSYLGTNNERWSLFTYTAANKLCTLPTEAQLMKLYNAYQNEILTVHGWPINNVYRTSTKAKANGQYRYVYMDTGISSYNNEHDGNNQHYLVTCLE